MNHLFLSFILGCFTITCFSQDQYYQLYNQAIYDVRNNECDSAIKKFEFLFKNSQDTTTLKNSYIFNSQCLRKKGAFQESLSSIDKAIQIDPSDIASYFDKIHVFNAMKAYHQIINICDSLVKTNISHANKADCYYYLGKSYALSGQHDNAIKYCDLLLNQNSTDSEAYFYKALSLEAKGELKDAKKQYSNAIKYNTRFGAAYARRGKVEIQIIISENDGIYISTFGKQACADLQSAKLLGENVSKILEIYCQ